MSLREEFLGAIGDDVSGLKAKIFELLRGDLKFRYAVAGLLSFKEILRRLDRHEAELVKLRGDMILDLDLLRSHVDAMGAGGIC